MEISEYECLPNSELKFNFFRKYEKPLTLKSTKKRIDLDFQMVSNVCALAWLTKIKKRLVLLKRLVVIHEKFTA